MPPKIDPKKMLADLAKKKAPTKAADKYDAHREKMAAASRARAAGGQEIGDPPPVKNPARRAACANSLRLFCEHYYAAKFHLAWSADHIKVIERLELCVRGHGLFALAMPRGSGKSELSKRAAEWGILYGYRRFVMLIGAAEDKADELMSDIKNSFENNEALAEDFPEACFPIRALNGESRRCLGQTCGGQRTKIIWTQDEIRLPLIKGAVCAGAVIRTAGLTGAIRGASATSADGGTMRPDLAILDDPQTRKALDIDTPIPTPNGFVRMGALTIGDTVFDERGQPCKITSVSEIFENRECYRVCFDDGNEIIADSGHLWNTSSALQRTNERRKVKCPLSSWAGRPQCRAKPFVSTRTTEEIAQTLTAEGGRNNHSIPLAEPIRLRQSDLPIPPYTFGVWLGDGASSSGRICSADTEIIEQIRADGYHVSNGAKKSGASNLARDYRVEGLTRQLRIAGVLNNKHVPRAYIFASREQRLSLLQGLMDTDGCVSVGEAGTKGIRCTFSNTNPEIVAAVSFLCNSLGIKCRISQERMNALSSKPFREVSFITTAPVFRLRRKASRLPEETKANTRRRFITAVEPVPTRPVRCIAVDSPSRLYLCGTGLIPTHNSAGSLTMNTEREAIIRGDVIGLAGPDRSLACIMPCTVVYPGDLADRFLSRDRNPQWNGERMKTVYAMPTNTAVWDQYANVRADGLRAGDQGAAGNRFYEAHRAELDEGCMIAWPARFDPASSRSAIQEAMNRKIDDPAAFAAESQNEPMEQNPAAANALDPDEVAKRITNLERYAIPRECSRITAMIDVGDHLLWWVVIAWDQRFSGSIVDYGPFPDQGRNHFHSSNPSPAMGDLAENQGQPQERAIYSGLETVTARILGRTYRQEETGAEMRAERCMIDANYGPRTDLVYQFARRSTFAPILLPSHGKFFGASSKPMHEWQTREREQPGPGWRISAGGSNRGRHILFDSNQWKTFAAERLRTPTGAPGCLSIYKPDHGGHWMLAEHCAAEYPVAVQAKGSGRQVEEWKDLPGRDNHLWDCIVGATVAASVSGLRWSASGDLSSGTRKKKRVNIEELYAQQRGA